MGGFSKLFRRRDRGGEGEGTAEAGPSSSSSSSSNEQAMSGLSCSTDVPAPSETPFLDAGGLSAPSESPYSHLDVTAVPSKMDNVGNFTGSWKDEYDAIQRRLEDAGEPARDQDIRFEMLKSRITDADVRGTALEAMLRENEPDARVMRLFTAPEWFFKKPGTPYTKDEMAEIHGKFQMLSADHPDMLMVPGSTVFRVAGEGQWYDKSDEARLKMGNTAAAFMAGRKVHEVQKHALAGDTDGYGRGSDLVTNSQGSDIKDKQVGDVEKKPNREYLRGRKSKPDSSLFDAGGRSFALEICGDHGDYRAADQAGAQGGVDAHILVSHGAQMHRNAAASKDQGLFVHNDGSDTEESTPAASVATATGRTRDRSQPYERGQLEVKSGTQGREAETDGHLGTFPFPKPSERLS
jgi:hypothetical protein